MLSIEVDAVLFDNDGVLVDSHAQVEQAWTQATSEFGLDIAEMLSELVGVRAVDTFSRYLPADQVDAACSRLEDLEVELADQTASMPGAQALLAALPSDRWTIATSATRRLAVARWEGAGIPVPAADRSVSADDVSAGKPDPEPFLAAAACLGFDPTRCVVFEDSSSGGAAGAAAGATVIAVGDQPWSTKPAARIPDLTAVTVADTSGTTVTLAIDHS